MHEGRLGLGLGLGLERKRSNNSFIVQNHDPVGSKI
jgi:hypothetical protein